LNVTSNDSIKSERITCHSEHQKTGLWPTKLYGSFLRIWGSSTRKLLFLHEMTRSPGSCEEKYFLCEKFFSGKIKANEQKNAPQTE
jgi:hypothetical protein